MTADRAEYALTYDQAVAMLPDGDEIHTFMDSPIALLGADWSRESVLALLCTGRPELSGDMATTLGHGIVAYREDDSYVFIATKPQDEPAGEPEPPSAPLAADRFDVKRSGAQVTLVCLRCSRRVDSWPVAGLDTITGAATAHQLAQHAGEVAAESGGAL